MRKPFRTKVKRSLFSEVIGIRRRRRFSQSENEEAADRNGKVHRFRFTVGGVCCPCPMSLARLPGLLLLTPLTSDPAVDTPIACRLSLSRPHRAGYVRGGEEFTVLVLKFIGWRQYRLSLSRALRGRPSPHLPPFDFTGRARDVRHGLRVLEGLPWFSPND